MRCILKFRPSKRSSENLDPDCAPLGHNVTLVSVETSNKLQTRTKVRAIYMVFFAIQNSNGASECDKTNYVSSDVLAVLNLWCKMRNEGNGEVNKTISIHEKNINIRCWSWWEKFLMYFTVSLKYRLHLSLGRNMSIRVLFCMISNLMGNVVISLVW